MRRNTSLSDGTITLRPYQASDIDSLHEAACESIAEVFLWLQWCHPGYSVDESKTWIEERPKKWEQGIEYDFTITDSITGLFLGGCGLNHIDHTIGMANLGYWVRTRQTKKGVATAATLLLAGFAFNELRLNRIEIVVDVANAASQRVAKKAGATREGILRNRLIHKGKPSDAVMFSLIPKDLVQT